MPLLPPPLRAVPRHRSQPPQECEVTPFPSTELTYYRLQRQLYARSERVKGIDFHPQEPWILTTLYSGS